MKEYVMKRYEPSTDEGSCEFCGYMSEASEGEYVLYTDAQATIARLTAELEAEKAKRGASKLPRLTDAMILAAAEGHYGKRRVAATGPGGISMTVDGIDYSFDSAMRRMWSVMNRHLARIDQRKEAGV